MNSNFFDIFRHCKSHPEFCALSTIRTGVFSKGFLLTPVLYLCFAVRTGVFSNDVKLGILILINLRVLVPTSDTKGDPADPPPGIS